MLAYVAYMYGMYRLALSGVEASNYRETVAATATTPESSQPRSGLRYYMRRARAKDGYSLVSYSCGYRCLFSRFFIMPLWLVREISCTRAVFVARAFRSAIARTYLRPVLSTHHTIYLSLF